MVRRLSGRDTRGAILILYDHLLALTSSPVAALNRAVALAAIEGPAAALDSMSPLASDKRMLGYQPYWAVRGHLLADAGRPREAREALTVAIGLSTGEAVRRYLEGKRKALNL
jgi:RNA polymerase sigma-70 factor (ECF subfamily)